MRKLKRKLRKYKSRFFYLFIVLAIISFAWVGYGMINTRLSLKARATKLIQEDYEVTYKYNLYSSNPYNLDCEVIITNLTNKTTIDWEIYVDLPADATYRGSYGAEYLNHDGNKYHFSSVTTQAATIDPGKSTSFHIQFSSPTSYELTKAIVYGTSNTGSSMGGLSGDDVEDTEDPTVISDPCENKFIHDDDITSETNGNLSVSYKIGSSWQNGAYTTYIVKASIHNSGSVNSSWLLMFLVNETATPTCYNGTCSINDNMLVILPPSWQSVIQPNSTIDYEFQLTINNRNNINLVYVGKNVDGYVLSCQPEYGR